ncbi:metallophosphoesterase [Facklamia sp. DSM 111018]|uniref:Phosphoesterase n=1 Tax=Facklamia lactis TaxID=2749967 RepID=A0ABS0LPN0_9LACT|nr:metallophosphoesterase [Facklamia lactis]MBG9980160.1 metallophosphoesterase [Facklamia lactis]MBG9985962.1 metallophosphoesterase [Facklamia lactis]
MKFLVMSDNHGNESTVNKLVHKFKGQVDYLFHCGDSEFTTNHTIWREFDAVVAGNMDFHAGYENIQIVDTPVGKVILTHGHIQNVNRSNLGLYELAKDNQASFLFHGHTHRLYAEYKDRILMVNPGSLSQSRGEYSGRTFAIVVINENSYRVDYYNQDGNYIQELSQYFTLDGDENIDQP